MPEPTFTADDLLAAFTALTPQRPDGAFTAKELRQAWGLCRDTTADRIAQLVAAGTMESVWAPYTRVDGVTMRTTMYRRARKAG